MSSHEGDSPGVRPYDERDWAGARALAEYGVLTVDGKVATMEANFRKLLQMARVVLNAAGMDDTAAELADERADRQAFHRHYLESAADADALRGEHGA